jgi:hypothetical protein
MHDAPTPVEDGFPFGVETDSLASSGSKLDL